MRRYIDAYKIPYHDLSDGRGKCEVAFLEDIIKVPTADVVEVVRCKDCKWWDNDGDAERCTHKYGGMWAKSDAYCSYGERADK